ncbi:unnamed protein product [Dicrocoelium dendriticum]|nr:unnamed protein product [Dicrocoelium dendriticum]
MKRQSRTRVTWRKTRSKVDGIWLSIYLVGRSTKRCKDTWGHALMSNLVDLLNLAASTDSSVLVKAGQQLVSLTSTSDSLSHVCIDLAHIVFGCDPSHLTLDGRFIGLIHLKNMISDASIWQNLAQNERDLFRSLLLSYLSSGCNFPLNLNEVEQIPRIGPTVVELVARFVRNEWLKTGWNDVFWEHLSNCCAWNSFRLAIRAAASFRLPARRRAFIHLVQTIIPSLLHNWKTSVSSLTNTKCCLQLTRLLCTLFASIGGTPKSGPFLFEKNDSAHAGEVLESSFTALLRLSTGDLSPTECFGPGRLFRHLSKLTLVTFMVCSPEVRDQFVHITLMRVASLISSHHLSVPGYVDRKSVSWLLALLYGILSSDGADCGAQLSILESGASEVRSWLSSPLGVDSTNLSELLCVLLRTWFPLSETEVHNLVTDPERCLSAGGASDSAQVDSSGGFVTYAISIWDVDSHTAELYKLDLRSLLGMHGAEQQTGSFESTRQLTELLITLLIRHYGASVGTLLLQILSTMKQKSTTALDYESIMRVVQLCFPHVGSDESWITFTDCLITDSLRFVECNFPLIPQDENNSNAVSITIMTTRVLCLLSRYTIYCSPTGSKAALEDRGKSVVAQLLRYINPQLPNSVRVGIRAPSLCVRLSAAQSLHWLIDRLLFPNASLSEHSQPLFHGLVQLIQDVSECETRVQLLQILCTLIEPVDVISSPQLTSQMLSLLDQLWSLDNRTTALRTSVLDAMCLVSTLIHSDDETDETLVAFRSAIQPSIASLVNSALSEQNGSGSEALLEPGLRLWASMVTGDGACWSDSVEALMPFLVGSPNGCAKRDMPESLFERLETSEDAELFFKIAEGSLILACKHSREQAVQFLLRWTEPFWFTILSSCVSQSDGSVDKRTTLDFLCSAAASVSDGEVDSESPCRVTQLNLLKRWLSVFMDLVPATTNHVGSQASRIRLTPSLIGFLVSAAWMSLKRAPSSAHDDVCPLATQERLSLLSIVAITPGHWLPFLHILHFAITNAGVQDSRFNQSLSEVNLSTLGPPNVESREMCLLVETCLDRWLARADSLSCSIDRRSFAAACLLALRYCATTVQNSARHITRPEDLDVWASVDPVHSRWLEPVVNFCILVLFDKDPGQPSYSSTSCFPHPEELATNSGLMKHFKQELSLWESCVGGPAFSDALFRIHVDPVLQSQLQSKLFAAQ